MDKNGFSDPYVMFSYGNQKFKTNVITKCLNPRWNEYFMITVLNSDPPEESIIFHAYDHDDSLEDDYMGFIEFKLRYLWENPEFQGWYKIRTLETNPNEFRKSVSTPFGKNKRRVEKFQELLNMKGEIELAFTYKSVEQMTQLYTESKIMTE